MLCCAESKLKRVITRSVRSADELHRQRTDLGVWPFEFIHEKELYPSALPLPRPPNCFCELASNLLQPDPRHGDADILRRKVLPYLVNNLIVMETANDAREYRTRCIQDRKHACTIVALDGFVLVSCLRVESEWISCARDASMYC